MFSFQANKTIYEFILFGASSPLPACFEITEVLIRRTRGCMMFDFSGMKIHSVIPVPVFEHPGIPHLQMIGQYGGKARPCLFNIAQIARIYMST